MGPQKVLEGRAVISRHGKFQYLCTNIDAPVSQLHIRSARIPFPCKRKCCIEFCFLDFKPNVCLKIVKVEKPSGNHMRTCISFESTLFTLHE